MSRDVGAAPLFGGQDVITLAASGDVESFGVGQWASVFATSTNPDSFDGVPVRLTGFVTPDPADAETMRLSRLVITHCVIDAQPAAVPVDGARWSAGLAIGEWVEVEGVVRSTPGGGLVIQPQAVTAIPEPDDPYEY